MIYFDHNATTAIDDRVFEAMLPYLTGFYGNPSSLYRAGRLVRSAIDTAREQVAVSVGATAKEIVFTSGGTEANNLALQMVAKDNVIALSDIEHPSVMEFAQQYKQRVNIPVDAKGLVAVDSVSHIFSQRQTPQLVSIMLANNETGAIQDIENIASFLKNKSAFFHVDAVQALGKVAINWGELDIDCMSLSSHKIYGPKGCGALVVKKTVNINPLLIGGGQEQGLRAGTENVAAIVGFGKAAELACVEMAQREEHCLRLRMQLEQGLKSIAHLTIFSESIQRLPNTIQFSIKGIDGEMLLMQLDHNNIALSSGSACASGGGKASAVLLAMGVDYSMAKGAVRVSLGKDSSESEVVEFIKVLKSVVSKYDNCSH